MNESHFDLIVDIQHYNIILRVNFFYCFEWILPLGTKFEEWSSKGLIGNMKDSITLSSEVLGVLGVKFLWKPIKVEEDIAHDDEDDDVYNHK